MSESKRDPVRFQRANFCVQNLERSYAFYRDVLGMSITFEKDSEPDSYSYPVFGIDPKHTLRFAILSTPSQPRVMALTEIQDENFGSSPLPRRAAIVLDIADIDGVVAASKAIGLKVFDEDALETHDGRMGREVGILDHDGNLVVIYNLPDA